MKARIANRIYLTDLTGEQSRSIKNALTFRNPKKDAAEQFGHASWDIPATLELFEKTHDGLIIPRGVGHCADQVQDERHSHPVRITTSIKTRPYQERAIRLALSVSGGLVVASTGAGKTTMGIEMAARLGQRCLILVKSLDLAKQWQGAIKQFTGLDCGLIGGGKWTEGKEFTVGLTQTLVKHESSLDYGLVIVDECHNIPAIQAYSVINHQAAKYRFGLSATPQRRDNLEMMIHAALGPIAAEIEEQEVEGSVLPVTVSTLRYNFQGNPESWVEFINLLAADETRNRLLIASAIKSSRIIGTAVLTGTIAHAERLHSLAKENGVDALLLHGQLPKKIREQRMKDAPNSQLIIGTLSLLSEGINWPHVGGIIFASPVSASVNRADPTATRLIQTVGRGRRPFPGKVRAHVLDIIDNHPFGKAAYKKRAEIYQIQGWHVR